ncbi:Dihydrofolate synthase @ Folylpolyglutamate synthase [hydrothermal vent metagenome]|uniref:Dihydrofolate synthase @ Folylpolyglutamate synthase n=1 Tax=hydrothermal vent metagenome TaxID=652676 RepID=A0A1W1BKG5_9ZZZZ
MRPLITPIDIDHEAFLGSTIKAIATTKLKAVQKHAIIAKQKHKEVYDVALNLEDEYGVSIEGIDAYIKEKDKEKIFLITQNNKLVPYLVQNLSLAAKAIIDSLKEFKYTLVYNSYKDKNYKEILSILKPIINDVEIINIEDERKVSVQVLQKVLDDMSIKHSHFKNINKSKKYLVFGSFSVAEAFLKGKSE